MATGGDIDTSELAELWSEEHISQLPTFEHFHNIHQIKVEESLDALPAKLHKNPENLPQKSKYKCVKLRAKDKKKRNTPCEKMYWPSSMNNRASEINNFLAKLKTPRSIDLVNFFFWHVLDISVDISFCKVYFSLFFIADLKSCLLPIWDQLQYLVRCLINLAGFTLDELFQWGDVTLSRFIKLVAKIIADPRSAGVQTFF